MEQAHELDPAFDAGGLSLLLTDDEGIRPLNREYFGTSTPTDVISIMYDRFPGDPDGREGEVIVNAERAQFEGPRHDGTARELALYIAHGCHHLTGASDDTPERKAQMRKVENAWLDSAAALDYIDTIIEEGY